MVLPSRTMKTSVRRTTNAAGLRRPTDRNSRFFAFTRVHASACMFSFKTPKVIHSNQYSHHVFAPIGYARTHSPRYELTSSPDSGGRVSANQATHQRLCSTNLPESTGAATGNKARIFEGDRSHFGLDKEDAKQERGRFSSRVLMRSSRPTTTRHIENNRTQKR